MCDEVAPAKIYLGAFAAPLALTLITYWAALPDLGRGNAGVGFSIAAVKALLAALYFMHVRHSPKLTWPVAGSGFFRLAILLRLTLSDYLTRGWLVAFSRRERVASVWQRLAY